MDKQISWHCESSLHDYEGEQAAGNPCYTDHICISDGLVYAGRGTAESWTFSWKRKIIDWCQAHNSRDKYTYINKTVGKSSFRPYEYKSAIYF